MSEGQDELENFEEEYFDLDQETLENEFIDFQVKLWLLNFPMDFIHSLLLVIQTLQSHNRICSKSVLVNKVI